MMAWVRLAFSTSKRKFSQISETSLSTAATSPIDNFVSYFIMRAGGPLENVILPTPSTLIVLPDGSVIKRDDDSTALPGAAMRKERASSSARSVIMEVQRRGDGVAATNANKNEVIIGDSPSTGMLSLIRSNA